MLSIDSVVIIASESVAAVNCAVIGNGSVVSMARVISSVVLSLSAVVVVVIVCRTTIRIPVTK